MTFFLRKFIEALLLPLGFGLLLILAGLVFRRRLWALAGVAVIGVAAMPVVGVRLMTPLERAYPERAPDANQPIDAVVLLSGTIARGVSSQGIQWGEAGNRFFTAVSLKLAGEGRVLILTDGHDAAHPAPAKGDLLRAEAIRRGVPGDQIVVVGRVLTTEDEARAVAALPGIRHIALVTSAFHMPRSKMLFSAFGLQVEPFPTDYHHFRDRDSDGMDFIPRADGYRDTEAALREYYGLAAYWLLLKVHPPKVSASVPAAVSAPR
jgi:uncharacterized SAM-binding protein YcdF (DUF218 family)